MPSLQPGLAESRQFGGCFVLGIQVSWALRDLYGRNGAETISGLCGNTALAMVFKLLLGAKKNRSRLDGSSDHLAEVIQGVAFKACIKQNQCAA